LRYSIKPKIFESLESNIDLDLTFTTSSNRQIERPRVIAEPEPGEDPQEEIIRRNESTWSGQIAAQYRFSENFTGGLSFRHERRKDKLRELTNMTYEFRLFGEIEFN
jgi:t-SNARE complex subunit (syntaxin)